MDEVAVGTLIASTLRVSTPLILCALAGTLCERAGVIDLGLEGKMLMCAFAAGAMAAVSGSLVLALLVAIVVGVLLSMLHAYACVSHRGDQVVMGMAITMTAAGLTVVLGIAWSTYRFVQHAQAEPRYEAYKIRIGRSLLLGLEILVAADIVKTIALELTALSLALLAGLVLVRTFLSWTLVLEIEGRWPWQREPSAMAEPRQARR